MQKLRLGKRTQPRYAPVKELVPLADLNDLVFGGWDIFPDNTYEAAVKAGVLPGEMLSAVRGELESVRPMPAVFEHDWVKNLDGPNVKKAATKMDLAEALVKDIEGFRKSSGASRAVMVWCGSTEVYAQQKPVHQTLAAFEKGLKENSADIPPSMIYAYAAIVAGIPYANGAPNLSVDVPALWEMARTKGVPIAGKDFKTGQTLMKTIIAPGLKARMLGLQGWFSTNILGNRDGEVLDDPGSFRSKEVSKASVLDAILQPELYPELYGDYFHKVRIEYYPPRGDAKEGWDNIDIVGWLGTADADQDRLSLPRLDPGRARRAGPAALPGSGGARRTVGHPGVAVLLLQVAHVPAGPETRARPVRPAPQADQHLAHPGRRRGPRPLRAGLLRGRGDVGILDFGFWILDLALLSPDGHFRFLNPTRSL